MDIKNVEISTGFDYGEDYHEEKSYHIELKFKIPGGTATYKLSSTENINKSIEKASTLMMGEED